MKLRPIFVEVLPDFGLVKVGELWISHKHRTINLRCPCGCGDLTVLSLHPSRWHVHFDGKSVSLDGATGGSVWAHSGCGSHYFIKKNTVIWANKISQVGIPSIPELSAVDYWHLTLVERPSTCVSNAFVAGCR